MEKSISVRIMGRTYTLRVNPEDEAITREVAAYVDGKMSAFRAAFPKQPEITSAVIAALAIGEELFTARNRLKALTEDTDQEIDDEINNLADLLSEALKGGANGVARSSASKSSKKAKNA